MTPINDGTEAVLKPSRGDHRWDARWNKAERTEALRAARNRLAQAEESLGEISDLMEARVRELRAASRWSSQVQQIAARADIEEASRAS